MGDVERSIVWIGAGTGLTITRIRTDSGAASIQSALLGHSNADFNDWWEGDAHVNSSPAPSNAQYPNLVPPTILNFLCADGTIAVVRLPAAKIGIFLADGVTVDASAITDVITACVGNLRSPSGSLATSFLGGTLGSI